MILIILQQRVTEYLYVKVHYIEDISAANPPQTKADAIISLTYTKLIGQISSFK